MEPKQKKIGISDGKIKNKTTEIKTARLEMEVRKFST